MEILVMRKPDFIDWIKINQIYAVRAYELVTQTHQGCRKHLTPTYQDAG